MRQGTTVISRRRARRNLKLGHLATAWVCGAIVSSVATNADVVGIDLYQLGTPPGLTGGNTRGPFASVAGGQTAGTGLPQTGLGDRAVLWTTQAPAGMSIHPSGYASSVAHATDGVHQVGYARPTSGNNISHAMLWSGSGASAVDLNPTGFETTIAYGVFGGNQVGYGWGPITSGRGHALLWSGSAQSYIDLHPRPEYNTTVAHATDGVQQVGAGYGNFTGGYNNAIVWSGSASSAVSLHPAGFAMSVAYGVGGGQQVGRGFGPATGNEYHAMLWSGSVESFVDLNPVGYLSSYASATDGTIQVGYGATGSIGSYYRALLWHGTAESAIDLHSYLPSSLIESFPTSIQGNTIYGLALDAFRRPHAVAWVIPSPSCVGMGLFLAFGVAPRRRR